MDLDPLKKGNVMGEKLEEGIEAAGERPSIDKISELLQQVCAIAVGNSHLFDDTTLLREALNLVKDPDARGLIRGTIGQFILERALNQEVSTPKVVSEPNRLGAVLNSTDSNAGQSSKSKAILCTGILIGTIFGGFILKCLCFLLFIAVMIAIFWIFGSMHKSQGLR